MYAINKFKELPFLDLYDKFIKDSKTGRRLQPDGRKISNGTIENYASTRKLLCQFSSEKSFVLRIRIVKHLDKKQLIVEKNYWTKFYRSFTDYLYNDCNHFDNYVGHTIKNIKTFFNYINKSLLVGTGEFHKSFYIISEQIPILTLMPEELNFFIYNNDFEEQLPERLREAKDVFVVGCTVALRFSDLVALKESNLRIANNDYYLAVRSKKTITDTRIKLPDYVIKIILKYRGKYKTLLPSFNKVDLNLYLKELLEKADLTQVVGKQRAKRGSQKEMVKSNNGKKYAYRFCDLITTHTMRRTAITTMLTMGVPEQLVRRISGHSPMSKEFFRYVSFAQSYQDTETERMFEKLKELSFHVLN